MKLNKLITLNKDEIKEIIEKGYIVFEKGTCWNLEKVRLPINDDNEKVIVSIKYNGNIRNFGSESGEDFDESNKCIQIKDLKLYINDCELLQNEIKEICDIGALEMLLIDFDF
jgi:hypothetical protein